MWGVAGISTVEKKTKKASLIIVFQIFCLQDCLPSYFLYLLPPQCFLKFSDTTANTRTFCLPHFLAISTDLLILQRVPPKFPDKFTKYGIFPKAKSFLSIKASPTESFEPYERRRPGRSRLVSVLV